MECKESQGLGKGKPRKDTMKEHIRRKHKGQGVDDMVVVRGR